MIVRTTEEITGTDRDVSADNWRSKRIVLAGDGVGFSFHETTISANSVSDFHYQHHVEAVWVVDGSGTLTDRETGDGLPTDARAPCTCSTATNGTASAAMSSCACSACSIHR